MQAIESKEERADVATRFSSTRQPERTGRPRESKDRLTKDVLKALADDFAEHGCAAVKAVRENEPAQYLKIIASLVPKEIEVTRKLDGIDDARLQSVIDLILQMRRPDDAKEIAVIIEETTDG